jgi:hypothetical protein
MSSPRDPDPDGAFEGRRDDGSDWQEPSHLAGEQDGVEPNIADRRKQPRDSDHTSDRETWRPPGWDLPTASPHRDRSPEADPSWTPPASPPPGSPPGSVPERPRGGLFGSRQTARDPEMERAFTYEGDQLGAQSWALQHGWTVTDGSGPEDAVLTDLLETAPVRPGKEARPAGVLRGRAGAVELVAFDVVYPVGRQWVAKYAVTAAPMLGAVPTLRLSPTRLWKHRIGGLLPLVSGNEAFDGRWQLLAAEDGPQVRRLVQDPAVQGLLLGTDDGDEFWTGAGHLAAVRLDGHRPQLIEHHIRLLTAIVGALAAGY